MAALKSLVDCLISNPLCTKVILQNVSFTKSGKKDKHRCSDRNEAQTNSLSIKLTISLCGTQHPNTEFKVRHPIYAKLN